MGHRGERGFPRIPGYVLEPILGQGSMATVYRARQEGMGRVVAIKVLRQDVLDNDKILKRLLREARLAARFNHPRLVRALDAGIHEGSCYFVMELIEGRSLRQIVESEGPLGEEHALVLMSHVADALSALHREHVIHRDVKPANVLVDGEGQALLADLGLAKIEFDATMTSQNRAVGTPAYMAPEQARGPDSVDGRADLFSLGATFYYLLAGSSPFEGESVGAVITKILYHDPPGIRGLRRDVSRSLGSVIVKLLRKNREERYQ